MTRLIYRGISHDGTRAAPRRGARDMIYRGIRHDGLAQAAPIRRGPVALCYRGVPHGDAAPASGPADVVAAPA